MHSSIGSKQTTTRIFFGDPRTAETRLAACRAAGRLADVLRRINDHPASQLHELLPWNWNGQPATLAA
jgi:hypothetical protein